MFFELKTILQPDTVSSPQQKKLYRLIEKIEQQKLELAKWQQAKDEVLQYTRKHLIPVYQELHEILFDQLQQLWEHLSHGDFSKADALLLDNKIQSLAQYLKSSQSLNRWQKTQKMGISPHSGLCCHITFPPKALPTTLK